MKRLSIAILFIVAMFTGIVSCSNNSSTASYDADLQVKYENIPAEKNVYDALDETYEKVYMLDTDKWQGIMKGDDWNSNYVGNVLNENKEAYNLFVEAINKEYFQVPENTEGLEELLPWIFEYREMALLWDVKSKYEFKEGNVDKAIDIALSNIKFGARITEDKGGLIEQMIGLVIVDIGLNRIIDITSKADISKEQAKECISALSKYDDYRSGVAQSFRIEYCYLLVPELERFRGAKVNDITKIIKSLSVMSQDDINQPDTSHRSPELSIINEEASKKIAAEYIKEAIEWSEAGYFRDFDITNLDKIMGIIMADPDTYPIRNFIGRLMLRLLVPGTEGAIADNFKTMSKVSLVKTLMALKAYKKDYGSLPDNLDALVPGYINEVPKDYIDGGKVKYSRSDKVLYAGSGKMEVVFKIDF
jgi:tetratricopeptide (TPR) repeat protein